jgi:opacity protein-like surface antigen
MKKFILVLLPFLIGADVMQAEEGSVAQAEKRKAAVVLEKEEELSETRRVELQARAACLFPQDRRIRKIYGKAIAEWELEVDVSLDDREYGWDGFFNLAYYQKSGRSTCSLAKRHTEMRNVAATLGALYEFEAYSRVHPYLGLGLGAAYVHFHNQSSHVKRSVNRWGVAFLAKSGVKFDVTGNFFLDLFVDYSYYLFNFNKGHCRNNVNTGGFLIGGGIGYRF